MTSPGILRRVLGDDPDLWQSGEAWAVVADLCEDEGFKRQARALRARIPPKDAHGEHIVNTAMHVWLTASRMVMGPTLYDTDHSEARVVLTWRGVSIDWLNPPESTQRAPRPRQP